MSRPGRNRLIWVMFALYLLALLWLMFFARIGGQTVGQINFRPFQTLSRYFWVLRHSADDALRGNALVNLVGNVALFIPLGMLLPMLFPALRRFGRFFLLAVLLILALETAQLATGLGTMDVDDLLLNLPGALLGFGTWHLLKQ